MGTDAGQEVPDRKAETGDGMQLDKEVEAKTSEQLTWIKEGERRRGWGSDGDNVNQEHRVGRRRNG